MKVVELFAGIGGFRKGFRDAADESKRVISFPFVSEWDKFAQKVTKQFGEKCHMAILRK